MMEIYVKLRTKTITLHVRPYDTIGVVKAKIQDTEGISPHSVRLMFNGKELKDGRTIAHHDIEMLNTLDLVYLEGGFQIYVRLRKKTISLEVEASDTIETVKVKIQDKFSCS